MAPPLIVRYDGTWPFWRRCARLLVDRAPAGRVLAVPATGRLDAVEAVLPGGTVVRGARAASEALWVMGGAWRGPALLARLPGSELVYAAVAALRGRLPG